MPDQPAGRKGATLLPMPMIAIALIALLILMSVGMWLTFNLFHLVLTLAVAGFVGWVADLAVPGELPYGWLGAVAAGVLGGWLGSLVLGSFGPSLFGVNILPTFVGAAVLAFGAEVVGKRALNRP
jgi:uncharacterized membrane protein YeaQ/YmgE (transglycosylase-associated protein family)